MTTETAIAERPQTADMAGIMEKVLISGDLKELSTEQRSMYYLRVCESVGVNPLTKPFDYIVLNGKLTLYAKRDLTDQLRNLRNVSVIITARERMEDVYVVTARATMPSGRTDESTGVVSLGAKKGDDLANAFMKAETKAKRRVTLSICGLGLLDETEVDSVPGHRAFTEPPPPARLVDTTTGEVLDGPTNQEHERILDRVHESLKALSGVRKTTGKKLIEEWMNETKTKVSGFSAMNNTQLNDLLAWSEKQLQPEPLPDTLVDEAVPDDALTF